MRSRMALSMLALAIATVPALSGEISLAVNVPRLEVSEYHRPYVAMWVERADNSVAANLAVWYAVGNKEGTKWLADLKQWWRRSGRELAMPIDGVTGATRPVGQHQLRFDSAKAPLKDLAPGDYELVIEAVREVGGREMVRLPFTWPARAPAKVTASGKTELGAVALTITP